MARGRRRAGRREAELTTQEPPPPRLTAALAVVFYRPRFALPMVSVAAVLTAFLILGDLSTLVPVRFRRFVDGSRSWAGWLVVAVLILLGAESLEARARFYVDQQPTHLAGSIEYLREVAGQTDDRRPPNSVLFPHG